jgi:hypothetical protein
MPKTWHRRAALWKKMFNQIQKLSPFREAARDLVADAKDAAALRNSIYHSGFQNFTKEPPLALEFARVKITKDWFMERHTVSIGDLTRYAALADSLNTRLVAISLGVTHLFPRPSAAGTAVR